MPSLHAEILTDSLDFAFFGNKESQAQVEIKSIETAAEYAAVLQEIDELMSSMSGTPQGNRLDLLATLITVYETKAFPLDAVCSDEEVKFRL